MKKAFLLTLALCLSLSMATLADELVLVSEAGEGTVAVAPGIVAPYGTPAPPLEISSPHPAWASITDAVWISSTADLNSETNGDCGSLRLFTRDFTLPGDAYNITASIEIAGDNAYDIELNGAPVGSTVAPFVYGCPLYWDIYPGDPYWTGLYPFQATTTYPLSPVAGTNTLEIVVRNWPLEGGSGSEGTENPTGLIYKLVINYDVPVPATIEKDMADEGELGDHITITLTVDNPYDANVVVEDVLPDGLAYIPDIDDGLEGNQNLQVDSEYVTPTIDGNKISVEVEPGEHEIVFVVQVVSVECEEILVTNTANVYAPEAVEPDDSSSVEITLYPYEGISKSILRCTEPDPLNVPMYTDVHWLLLIKVENIAGDEIDTMEDIVVKDNFGGDLELDEAGTKQFINPPPSSGTVTTKEKGNTKKIQMTWDDLDDLADGEYEQLWLEISTDENPGQGKKNPPKNEYTEAGPHDLNSGVTVKFIDPATGLQLSAHTCPLTVEAYDPMLP